jgi:hypothetical protein
MSARDIVKKDPANFTPTLGDYKDLQPFRFWCQKVLPLVYDDSLSYYELLCKVVDYLNKAMEDVGVLEGDVTGLHAAYKKLQGYVNDYFSTLDVQEEINNKLDSMASSGELTTLIEPLLPNLISNWLSKNITPTSPVIDKTLTISGAGADSKIVGDKFNASLLSFDKYNGSTPLSELKPGWYPVTANTPKTNLPSDAVFGLLIVYPNISGVYDSFFVYLDASIKTNYIKVDENAWTTISNYISNKFIGKTIITYGDSITHANNWQPYLNRELHCSTENYGIDGSKISGNNATSMCNIERINTLPDLSFMIIMGGMNDWAQNVSIDGDENDVTNFTGGCHALFKNIINKYPSANIYCIGTSFGYMDSFSEKTKNNIGLTTLDYSKKLCEIANMYGIPSISSYENMGVCDINKTLYLKNDGDIYIHPNDDGAKRLANVIINLLTGNKYI